ncbi:hypothetical protein T05_11790 [Trichinella murrelli]|uniref:DUF7107 domain-containing protein n=1 Tax=Trichinella murrelli TaxID=144512 RepID=A0A0V0U633_9BILA|nr:hypothetical protein T05_11790 [Trichinella murrelli]
MSGHLEKFEKSLSEKYSRNVVIVCQDMPNKYVALAVHVAAKGINRELPMEKIVGRIVEACTRAKGHSHWNCITAPRFGFDVAYAEEYMLQFKIDNHSFLLFRTKENQNKAEYVNYGIDPFTGYKIDPSVGYFGLDPYTGLTIFPASRQHKVVPQKPAVTLQKCECFLLLRTIPTRQKKYCKSHSDCPSQYLCKPVCKKCFICVAAYPTAARCSRHLQCPKADVCRNGRCWTSKNIQ